MIYLAFIYVSKEREGLRWAATTKMGPNDARRVVWAIGMYSFLEIIFFISQLMNYATYRFYLSIEDMKEGRVGSGNENGPKQHQMRHLGQ